MTDLPSGLNDVVETAATLETPSAIVEAAARALSRAHPGGIAGAMIFSGWPARAVPIIAGWQDDAPLPRGPFERYQQTFHSLPVAYDRYRVDVEDRHCWREVLADGLFSEASFRQSPIYREVFSRLGALEHGRMVVCVGARPVAHLACLLPEGEGFSETARRALRQTALACAGPLRVAARLHAAEAVRGALDHLVASRQDAVVVVGSSGALLAASPPAETYLSRHPALARGIRDAVRTGGAKARTVLLSRQLIELHLTPCSPRGAASATLVFIGETAPPSRGRVSPREAEVIALARQGRTNGEIAEAMGVAPSTVKTWLQRLYRRTGARGRAELLG